jgi:hypothetical protein
MRQNLLAKVLEGVVAMDAQYSSDADYSGSFYITSRGRAVFVSSRCGKPTELP